MNIDIMERTENYAVGAVAAIAAFAVSAKTEEVASCAALTAMLISLLGWLRYRALHQTIAIHNMYISEVLEKKHIDALRFTSFYIEQQRKQGFRFYNFYNTSLYAARLWIWIALGFFSVTLLALVYFHGPFGGDDIVIKRWAI